MGFRKETTYNTVGTKHYIGADGRLHVEHDVEKRCTLITELIRRNGYMNRFDVMGHLSSLGYSPQDIWYAFYKLCRDGIIRQISYGIYEVSSHRQSSKTG